MKNKLTVLGEWFLRGAAFGLPIAIYFFAVFLTVLTVCDLQKLKSEPPYSIPKGDWRACERDLVVKDTLMRKPTADCFGGKGLEILGTISNSGEYSWHGIMVQIDFFDENGAFIDQADGSVNGVLSPGEALHFKFSTHEWLRLSVPSEKIRDFRAILSQVRVLDTEPNNEAAGD